MFKIFEVSWFSWQKGPITRETLDILGNPPGSLGQNFDHCPGSKGVLMRAPS